MVVATGMFFNASAERYAAYSSSFGFPVLLTWSPAEITKFRSGFCARAVSKVRSHAKPSLRAAVLATPESALNFPSP